MAVLLLAIAMESFLLYTLIARKLAGEASPSELEQLQSYLIENPQDQYLEEIVSTYWNKGRHNPVVDYTSDEEQEELHFQKILTEANKEEMEADHMLPMIQSGGKKKFGWTWYAAAAVLILSLSLSLYYYLLPTSPKPKQLAVKEVLSGTASRSVLELPDGTKVWLNADSKLVYGEDFNGDLRQVNLEGEAFFDVVKDSLRPFIVHTSNIDIRVLGTAFNVKAYAVDPTIETTLIRGSVEVIRKDDPSSPKMILRPNEKLVYNKEQIHTPVEVTSKVPVVQRIHQQISIHHLPENTADSIRVETSWRFNRLILDGETFEMLASKIGRWYNVDIRFEDKEVRHYRFKGVFEKETIEQALSALQLTAPFEYEIKNNIIYIRKK